MKIDLDIKKKKGSFEADVEKIVEKGMDNREKDWKEKFSTKHEAKKELIQLKHKNKIEEEEQKLKKKNWFEKRAEEKAKLKELELEQQRKEQEELKKIKRMKMITGTILLILGMIMILVGFFSGSASGNSDSPWYVVSLLGIIVAGLSAVVFVDKSKKKK